MGDAVNPEVSFDTVSRPQSDSVPDPTVDLVKKQLRLITNKLENAYNGVDVEWDGNLLKFHYDRFHSVSC